MSRDLIVAGHQQITQEWWANHRETFELFVSQTVFEEVAEGDQEAAQQRLRIRHLITSRLHGEVKGLVMARSWKRRSNLFACKDCFAPLAMTSSP